MLHNSYLQRKSNKNNTKYVVEGVHVARVDGVARSAFSVLPLLVPYSCAANLCDSDVKVREVARPVLNI